MRCYDICSHGGSGLWLASLLTFECVAVTVAVTVAVIVISLARLGPHTREHVGDCL